MIDGNYKPSLIHICLAITLCIFLFMHKETANSQIVGKSLLFGFSVFLLRATLVWCIKTFPLYDVSQVVMTLQLPLDGFYSFFIKDYFYKIFLVFGAISFILIPFFSKFIFLFKKKGIIIIYLLVILMNGFTFCDIPIKEYVKVLKEKPSDLTLFHSSFFNKHYINADSIKIFKAPKPQNLILILMESMENFPHDYVKEIKKISQEHTSFALSNFGGGEDIAGSINTFTSTISKITGTPMLLNGTYKAKYLSKCKSIYDILNNYGYMNIFIQGTDSKFAGTKSFLLNHGIDKVYDMNDFKEWDMAEFFRNFRTFSAGLTDKRVYDISKEILDTLTQPFSLTLSTIETHYPYGFYNSMCLEKPKNLGEFAQFEATLKCASRMIDEFINWLKQQPFYKNTLIVIVGDHLFMGNYLTENRDRKWINIFINPQIQPVNKKRKFISVDIAPSILESLGFEIENHKMGFGTSLFSEEKTLLEIFGKEKLNNEFNTLVESIEYNSLHLPKQE